MTEGGFLVAQGSFGSFWALVANSGLVAQLVLLILLLFSLLSWSIIFRKFRRFREVRRQSDSFYQQYRVSSSLSDIYRTCEKHPMSPLAGLFKNAYRELSQQVSTEPNRGERKVVRSLTGLQRTLQRASLAEMTTLEESLSWLATTGSVTPFIGLFGTVIGIINAFQGLGEGTTTTIQAVAPGISEALVATAAGLFAAIPAVIGYNHFLNDLKVFGAEMDDFASELLNLVERNFS